MACIEGLDIGHLRPMHGEEDFSVIPRSQHIVYGLVSEATCL